jgi:beta-lactamase class A
MRSLHSFLIAALVLVSAFEARSEETLVPGRAAAARAFLARVEPAADLQAFLDHFMESRLAADPELRRSEVRVALLDLASPGAPRLAHWQGTNPIYPASVVKFVYLMAAYAFQEDGRVRIDAALDQALEGSIRVSSNQATQEVFERLTGAEPGPSLSPEAYAGFRERRLTVERWLKSLGIDDLHSVNPTYDGGDISSREKQFLTDRSVPGGLPSSGGEYVNRNAMTAVGTAKLLALLASDHALTPEDAAVVRRRMKRDSREQRHLAPRIAGGAERVGGLEVYAKSGTWGPIYADAGIVRHPSGREIVLAVFTEAHPHYRGDFIADLTESAARRWLAEPGAAPQ